MKHSISSSAMSPLNHYRLQFWIQITLLNSCEIIQQKNTTLCKYEDVVYNKEYTLLYNIFSMSVLFLII